MTDTQKYSSDLKNACHLLREAKSAGAGLLILSGAGLSVKSGVPVFRMADGSMSPDFLKFLGDYNIARKKHDLSEAPDWFSFSVPDMFKKETAVEAWQYWRWRILRALVAPAEDYQLLNKIIDMFGKDKIFTMTSNCDMLHASAGLSEENIYEIHGSLGYLQCSEPCNNTLHKVDSNFLEHLRSEPNWVPMCPACDSACLRPNVMIFMDHAFVDSRLNEQEARCDHFKEVHLSDSSHFPAVVLEVGAGRVVSSIRCYGESFGEQGSGLIRINPSTVECQELQLPHLSPSFESKYFGLDKKADAANICEELEL